ncbi:MAG: hypothetical protein ACK4M7_08010 [Burkholderiales bacterium]
MSELSSTTLKTTAKRTRTPNAITAQKWFVSADGATIYSYLPRTMPNRTVKDELTTVLKKKNVEVSIFSKELSLKSTGEKINSYVIATRSDQFNAAFPDINSKATNVNLPLSKQSAS